VADRWHVAAVSAKPSHSDTSYRLCGYSSVYLTMAVHCVNNHFEDMNQTDDTSLSVIKSVNQRRKARDVYM
jgi:hypothetical protein